MTPDRRWLSTVPIAHRGLHDAASGIPENSLSAFAAAVAEGYAIELDLRLSRDGAAVVFHDETLGRMTRATGAVHDRTVEELNKINLVGSGETIPTLAQVLTQVNARVPLLIEIKAPTRYVGKLEATVAEGLRDYRGSCAVQSFNPLCIGWFRQHAPEICRGLLSADFSDKPIMNTAKFAPKFMPAAAERFALRHLLSAPFVHPHFIGYDVDALPALAPWITKHLGLPLLAWTVRSERQREIGAAHADNVIFEGYRPALRRDD